MNNFKTVSDNSSVTFTAADGAFLKVYYDPTEGWVRETSAMTLKDKQYAMNVFNFVRKWVAVKKTVPKGKTLQQIATAANNIRVVNNFRGLSNNLRRAFDTGKTLGHAEFQKEFFYEGQMVKY